MLRRTLWERLFVLTLWNMYVISSKGIPADVTGGDDVATRKFKKAPAMKVAAASSEVSAHSDVGSMACD